MVSKVTNHFSRSPNDYLRHNKGEWGQFALNKCMHFCEECTYFNKECICFFNDIIRVQNWI